MASGLQLTSDSGRKNVLCTILARFFLSSKGFQNKKKKHEIESSDWGALIVTNLKTTEMDLLAGDWIDRRQT